MTLTRSARQTVESTLRRRARSNRTTIALVVVAVVSAVASSAAAFARAPRRRRSVASRDSSIPSRTITTTTTALSSSSSDDDDSDASWHRLAVIGASVSPRGFVALLSHGPSGVVLPVPVSSSRRLDAEAATSLEALTFLQLLGGVDVGAEGVLPVGASVRLAAARCRSLTNEAIDDPAVEAFRSAPTRTDDWGRVRTVWPDVRVDRVELRMDARRADDDDGPPVAGASFTLACTVSGRHPLSVPLDGSSSYDDGEFSSSLPSRDPDDDVDDDVARRTLAAFRALALALRYRVPVESSDDPATMATSLTACVLGPNGAVGGALPSLADAYPAWRSADSLELQSTRVAETVRKGFEANRLEGALRVAVRVGDRAAEERIRRRIAEYDRLDDLPVLGEDDDGDADRQRSSPDDAVLGEGEDGTWG